MITRQRRSGWAVASCRTAEISTSGPFSGWIRPAKTITSSSGCRPSACRAASAAPAGPGENTSVSTPGGTTSILPGSAPYSSISCVGLGGGVRHQPVGLGDHLLLADQPAARLRLVVLRHGGVLDLGQGVRGMHHRHPPAILGQVADLPGEPVVRVHDVVVPGIAARLGPHHPGGERAQLAGKFFLVQPLEGARDDVPDQHTRHHLGHRRLIGGGGPGEDLHLDPAGGQPAGGLVDVDVHPAGVTGARLGQRRGVQRDRRHPGDAAGRTTGYRRRGHGGPPTSTRSRRSYP